MKSFVFLDNADLSSSPPRDFLADSRWKILGPGVLFIIIIGLFAPLFMNPGTHLIVDQPMWTAFTKVLQKEILPEQKWFWGVITDRENAGLIMGRAYSLNIILISIFSLFFSADASVKIFLLISVLFFSLAFYFVCRKMMNPFFSAIAALFVLVGIHKNAIHGMCYSHLSMGFAFCFWITSIRFFSSPNSRPWTLSVILLSLTIYAHPMGFILGSVIWMTLLIFGILTREKEISGNKLAVYALIPIIAVLLAGPQIWAMMFSPIEKSGDLSYLKSISHFAPLSWEIWLKKLVKIQFSEILRLDSLLLFMLVGFLVFVKMDPRIKWPVCGIYLGGLLLCAETFRLLPFQPSVFLRLVHFSWRFPIYLHIVFIILAGIGFDYLAKKTLAMVPSFPLIAKDLRRFRFLIVLLALGLCFIQVRTVYNQRQSLFMTLETFDRKEDLHHLWEWLSKNVDGRETRVYFEDTFGTYPRDKANRFNHPLALTSVYTNLKQIGGWCGFVTPFAYQYNIGMGGYLFGALKPDQLTGSMITERMKLLNCSYLVGNSLEVKDLLEKVQALKRVATFGDFFVYEYKGMNPAWAYKTASFEKVDFKKINSQQYEMAVHGQAGDRVQISLAYHPNWRGWVNGTPISIDSHMALMQIVLPQSGFQQIRLEFAIEKKKPLFLVLIGFALIIFLPFLFLKEGPTRKRGMG